MGGVLSYYGGKKQEKAERKAYRQDIGKWREQLAKQEEWQEGYKGAWRDYTDVFAKYARWQPEERKAFMRSAAGLYSGRAKALKREGAKNIAGRGTGGGSYGRMAYRINREKLAQVAQALGQTYGPKATPSAPSAGPWTGVPGSGAQAPSYSASADFWKTQGKRSMKYEDMFASMYGMGGMGGMGGAG